MSLHSYVLGSLADRLAGGMDAGREFLLDYGDCRIRIRSNSEPLMAWLDAAFGTFSAPPGPADIEITAIDAASPAIPLELMENPPSPGKHRIKEEYANLPGGRLVRKRATGMVFLFGSGLNLAVGPCAEAPNQVMNFVNSRYVERKLAQGCLLGHSAAVASVSGSRMRGLAICGFSGAGKTTLALHAMSRGAIFVSNERLLVSPGEDGPSLFGVAKLPRISPGTALNDPNLTDVIPPGERERLQSLREDELRTSERKYDVFPERCFGEGRFVLAAPLHGVVALNWRRNGGATRIAFVKPTERPDLVRAFMKPAGPFRLPHLPQDDADRSDPGVDEYAAALARCDFIEISGGVNFADATDFCMEYLKQG